MLCSKVIDTREYKVNCKEAKIEGYIDNKMEVLKDFMENYGYFPSKGEVSIDQYKDGKDRFGIISSIFVPNDFLQTGVDEYLIWEMLNYFYGQRVEYVYFASNNLNSNILRLHSWYERFGFKVICSKSNHFLMFMDMSDY